MVEVIIQFKDKKQFNLFLEYLEDAEVNPYADIHDYINLDTVEYDEENNTIELR